ncbi:MAG: hypothetical protein K1X94_05495 [Sandaracinaceae bacterium]|nr:hypothetical protein [Sandaracinaceae bacterium]
MTWRARIGFAALAFCAVATGCGGRTAMREFSLGQYDEPPPVLFARVLSGVQALGYVPTSVDGARGTIVTNAAFLSRRDGAAQLRVQLYREGWVSVTVTGGPVRRDARGALVPGELANEYQAFVLGLRDHIEPRDRP